MNNNMEKAEEILQSEGFRPFASSERDYTKLVGGVLKTVFLFSTGVAEWDMKNGKVQGAVTRISYEEFFKRRNNAPPSLDKK